MKKIAFFQPWNLYIEKKTVKMHQVDFHVVFIVICTCNVKWNQHQSVPSIVKYLKKITFTGPEPSSLHDQYVVKNEKTKQNKEKTNEFAQWDQPCPQ